MSDEQLCLPSPEDPGRPNSGETDATTDQPGGHSDQDAGPAGNDPPPDGASQTAQGRHPGRQRSAKRSARHTYPSEEQCLAALAKLAGLVILGYVRARDAIAVRSMFSEILRWHRASKSGGEARRIDDADLRSMLRTNPELANLLAPLLTDDQIDLMFRMNGEQDADG